nr:retrotransposon protein Ty1-copia subclass [Tanacetum cinerariifolium]
MKFKKDHLCFACEQGKIHQKHHKSKTAFASNKPLYLLHLDLCGPMRVESINGKRYVLVVVDDYSRYTWVFFLYSKDEASDVIISFSKKTQVNLQLQVQRVRTDNGTEFKNKTLAKFFDEFGITQQFSATRTPQQNGVVERRNRFLNNLQPEWKQYGTLMRQTKNLMDINSDALCNILKQNQSDVNDALGYKTKVAVFTLDPLALVLLESDESYLSAKETIAEVAYYTSESKSEFEYETSEYYDNSTNYGLFVNNDDDQEIFHDAIESASENFIELHIDSQKDYDKSEVDHNDSEEKGHLVDKLIRKFNHKIAKCQKRIEKANQ